LRVTDELEGGLRVAGASMLPAAGSPPVAWQVAAAPMNYRDAVAFMEERVAEIAASKASELVWLVEHPPLYTGGTSAKPADLLTPDRFPVYPTGRGGQYTYHGPGQRVAYAMLDLNRRTPDLRRYVAALEAWLIAALAEFNLRGERREDRIGVWVRRPGKPPGPTGEPTEDKIAAIGIRVRRWVSYHGISLNVEPDLSHFGGITPCGIEQAGLGVTSLADLGHLIPMHDVDVALKVAFEKTFGKVERVQAPLG
jgi:lipoyl(octanoyl) transferase